jgi:hypothetical protein
MELLNNYQDLEYTINDDGLIVIKEESLNEVKKL